MGNPALEPLVRQCHTPDTLIVQINPTHRDKVPVTAQAIADRVNEITFNASLMREIRSYADVTRLIDKGIVQDPRVQRAYFHLIAAEDEMAHLNLLSKLDTSWSFLTWLRDIGKQTNAGLQGETKGEAMNTENKPPNEEGWFHLDLHPRSFSSPPACLSKRS